MKLNIWIAVAGCSTTYTAVSTDYDRSVNFGQYKTFAWLPDKADAVNSPYNNEIIRNNIRNYLGLCMSDRGYAFDSENPDLLLQLVITNAKKERVLTTYPAAYYYRPYYFGSLYYSPYPYHYYYQYYPTFTYAYPGVASTEKQEYVEGAITLSFIDTKRRQPVWTSTAKGDIYDPSHIIRDLHPAVHRIIESYPVKPLMGKSHRII